MRIIMLAWVLLLSGRSLCQHQHTGPAEESNIPVSAVQPVMSGFNALVNAFEATGIKLSSSDSLQVQTLIRSAANPATISNVEHILDKYCLMAVTINPEARVSVSDGTARRTAVQNEWKAFLIKVVNEAGITSRLNVSSENARLPYHSPSMKPWVDAKDSISNPESHNRFLQLQLATGKPLLDHLSGARIEYQLIKMYFSEPGSKEITLAADAGKGTSDLAYRNSTRLTFEIQKPIRIMLSIRDRDGQPGIASFTIKRLGTGDNELSAYYPLPAARVAANDEYPDFFFQPQVYRQDGEELDLAPGVYSVAFSHGPESLVLYDTLQVPAGTDSLTKEFTLQYWFDPSAFHYFSSDHHVHAAGCSHYDSPEEGVDPRAMWRQQIGEDLNVSANLAWGPSWYHQKTFFTGRDEIYSTGRNILHNDVEVSGFPSSPSGHVVLLGLKEDDYPGTSRIEQWPSWTAPVLQWAKGQGAIVGYAHSGWGLEPMHSTDSVFNYQIPKMDGIGADEFIATVTQHLVDFYSLGDTPAQWELTMLYHTWNCGFRTKLSGETDFPCITDERVGQGRSYFKTNSGKLSYAQWLKAIREGSLYVSDGRSHIMDFAVNGSQQDLSKGAAGSGFARISARVAAFLPETQGDAEKAISASLPVMRPFWNLERARSGRSRKVKVECIMNGKTVDSVYLEADGKVRDISFNIPISKSAWFALRIFASSHTNAIFLEVDGKPVCEPRSIEWCIRALNECWLQKSPGFRAEERGAAGAFYKKAESSYRSLLRHGE